VITTAITSDDQAQADAAAPLDSLLVQAARGPYRRFVPDASTAKFAGALLRHPRRTGRRVADLARELSRVGTGTSTTAPSRRDRRFTDPAWTQNPLLRRLVQGYLATGQTVQSLVADADLGRRDAERVSFLVENLVEALAPSNVPIVNPSSAKAVIDTAGLSLIRGGRAFARDMASAPRVPEMVDGAGFELGQNIAATPGEVVHRTRMLELIRYRPQTEQVRRVPLLIVPPTINKYYALDLAPGRSLVEYLVQQGQQVFVCPGATRTPGTRTGVWTPMFRRCWTPWTWCGGWPIRSRPR
jgi:polyhydroxyalkanoate synthase